MKDNIVIHCSKKEEWSKLMTLQNFETHVEIHLDDKDQLTNLIYLLPIIDKLKYKMPMVLIKGRDSLLYEADALLFLSNQSRIAFSSEYKRRKNKLNFEDSLPFLKFQRNDLRYLNTSVYKDIYNEEKSKEINFESLKGKGQSIEFIRLYIQKKITEWSEAKNSKFEILKPCLKEMNLLSLFLFIYQINKLSDEIQEFELHDLKQVIKQLAVGIYEIIENSCNHSIGEISYLSLSKINLKITNSRDIEGLIKNNTNILNKKNSFLKNYNTRLENDRYIFIRLIDSISNEVEEQTLIQKLKRKKLINEDWRLKEFFEKLYKDEEVYTNNSVSNEYGLITFLSSAEALDMQLLVNSGNDSFLFTNQIGSSYKFISDIKNTVNTEVTEFCCIVPVKPLSKLNKNVSTSSTDLNFLDKPNLNLIATDFKEEEVKSYYESKVDKENIINDIFDKWVKIYKSPDKEIFRINVKLEQIEFLVKLLSIQIERSLINSLPIYIILNFVEEERGMLSYKVSKFFQYYKVAIRKIALKVEKGDFHVLENGKQKILKLANINHDNYQIGFYHTKDRKMNYISTMVGISWDSIVLSFINNILYNNELSLENYFDLYLDQIKFKTNKLPKELKIFPFEFYIRGNDGKNQFIETIINFCQSETVKHKNVNVLLPSGLYLKNFYVAEHLFMNRYCVKKIALLIKQDFDKNIKPYIKNKKIILVSYGNYSHFLCEEIRKLLDCQKLLIPHIDILELQIDENKKILNYEEYEFIGILPIGSTLFSYYKMNAYLRKYYKIANNTLLLKNNYSILVVAPEENNFWKRIKIEYEDSCLSDSFDLLIMKERTTSNFQVNENEENTMKVRYMVQLDPEWKEEVGKELAVTHIDKTSTIPNFIYQTSRSKVKLNNNVEETNISKFKYLKNAVEYGHYSLNYNHYLFYINPIVFFKKANEKCTIQNELIKLNEKIDPLAYNIIISPLNDSNNDFLESIIKYVFANKVSILQYDPHNTYRDNFINKNYIILKNIENILKVSSNTNVNIYFVDNTIISAKTIKRAKELIHALLKKVNCFSVFDRFPKRLFEKAFILINRCSDNTLETIMDGRENIYMFIDINCPHFDTMGDCCPDCNIQKNYNFLADFTSNELLRKQLLEISSRHKVKKITPNYTINPNSKALARLCFTHFILNEIKNIDWTNGKYVEIITNLFNNAVEFVSKVIPFDELEYKILFAKTISRPLISTYELMKQAGFSYLKFELEYLMDNKFADDIPKEYFHTLIQRISYYGTSYLKENKAKILEFNIDKNVLDRALLWEEAYARGIIK